MRMKTATAFERALLTASSEAFSEIPEREEDIVMTFSEDFLRRNEALLRETDSKHQRYVNKVWKRTVLIAVIAALLTMTAMAVPAVREAIAKLFIQDEGTHYEFTFDPEQIAQAPRQVESVYKPIDIPQGYALDTEIISRSTVCYIWNHSDRHWISFHQVPLPIECDSGGGINSEGAEVGSFEIDGCEVLRIGTDDALFYVWIKDGYYFELCHASEDLSDEVLTEAFRSIRLIPDAVIR